MYLNIDNIPLLEGKLVSLAPFAKEHLNDERYLKWLNDYEVMKTINRPEYLKPVALETAKTYYEGLLKSNSDLFWAVYYKVKNLFVGTLRVSSINMHSLTADVGILIGERDCWGKGIASDAISSVCAYLFYDLGIRKLTAGAMSINLPMIKVFEKLGFKKEGVRRLQDRFEDGFCDHIYLGCFENEFLPAVRRDR